MQCKPAQKFSLLLWPASYLSGL